jgi:hypothetical protein
VKPRVGKSAVRCVGFALLLAVAAMVASAHSIFDLDDWMQRIDDGNQNLQRHIDARDLVAARDAAREIEDLYTLMQEFFEKREGAADAVRWSREGREYAQRAQAELGARRFAAAKRQALALAHGCRDCHFQYKPL